MEKVQLQQVREFVSKHSMLERKYPERLNIADARLDHSMKLQLKSLLVGTISGILITGSILCFYILWSISTFLCVMQFYDKSSTVVLFDSLKQEKQMFGFAEYKNI